MHIEDQAKRLSCLYIHEYIYLYIALIPETALLLTFIAETTHNAF